MAAKLFVDTWGWLSLRDKAEARHQEVASFYNQFISGGGSLYTTDYVLNETYTLLWTRLPAIHADESMRLITNMQ